MSDYTVTRAIFTGDVKSFDAPEMSWTTYKPDVIFLGYQPHQVSVLNQRFEDHLSRHHHRQGLMCQMGSPESHIYTLSVGWWAGLVFYLRLSLLGHWCIYRLLKHFYDGAPGVAQVKPIVSVKVIGVQPDLNGLLHQVVHISCCHLQFGGAIEVIMVKRFY